MKLSVFTPFFILVKNSIIDPRKGVRTFLDMHLPFNIIALAACVIAIFQVILSHITLWISSINVDSFDNQSVNYDFLIMISPINNFLIQILTFIFCSIALYAVGRLFNGDGEISDSFATVFWLNFITTIIHTLIFIIFFIVPALSNILSIMVFGLIFYLAAQFTMELHHFTNISLVFVGIIGTFLVISFIFVIIIMRFNLLTPLSL